MAIEFDAFLEGLAVALEEFKAVQMDYAEEKVNEGVNIAKGLAPVGTGEEDIPGELRDSIRIIEKTEKHIDWGTTVPYAPEVEYGTTKMSAQPFMRPAMAKLKRKL